MATVLKRLGACRLGMVMLCATAVAQSPKPVTLVLSAARFGKSAANCAKPNFVRSAVLLPLAAGRWFWRALKLNLLYWAPALNDKASLAR